MVKICDITYDDFVDIIDEWNYQPQIYADDKKFITMELVDFLDRELKESVYENQDDIEIIPTLLVMHKRYPVLDIYWDNDTLEFDGEIETKSGMFISIEPFINDDILNILIKLEVNNVEYEYEISNRKDYEVLLYAGLTAIMDGEEYSDTMDREFVEYIGKRCDELEIAWSKILQSTNDVLDDAKKVLNWEDTRMIYDILCELNIDIDI